MTDAPKIEEREDGPLIFKKLGSMRGADGAEVELKPVMALCRCGHSGNKPFCDGSHNDAGFKSRGGEPSGVDRLLSYKGEEVTVTYNPRVCSHAAECVRRAGDVFDPERKPWCDPDQASAERVREVVAACPSGALQIGAGEAAEHLLMDRAQVTVQKNGPYWVQGIDPPVEMPNAGMTAQKYVLCRCGKSGNKPFCDGSHRDAGWTDV